MAVSTTSVARACERWVMLVAMKSAWIDRPTTIRPMSAAAAAATVKKNSIQCAGSSGSYIGAV